MRRPTAALIALGLVATALAGCAHERAASPDYRWTFLNDADEAPRLSYGRPSSDEVLLMLACAPGADSVRISATGLGDREIILRSDEAQTRFPAQRAETPMSDEGLLEARGRMSASALAGFQLTGRLAVLQSGTRHSLDAGRVDRGQVTAFFRSCAA